MRAEALAPVSIAARRTVTGWQWLVPALLFSLVFIMAARAPIDSDLWWHLRAGEETLRAGRPLLVDTFSHTRAGASWTNHSWLGQVIYYLLFYYGHYSGLVIAVALMAATSMVLVYYQMEGSPWLRAFIIVLAAAVAGPLWSPRPQLISLCLFAALSYLLYVYKWRRIDRLWLSVPLFILWSNLHAGYVLGLSLIASMILGELANHILGTDGEHCLAFHRIGRLALWGAISGLAVVINPNGVAMWWIPFRTVGMEVLQSSISEWSSPDFHDVFQQPFIWLSLLTVAAIGLSRRRLDASDFFAFAAFTYLALLARRNFAPFALVAAPILSRHLHAIWLAQGRRWRARQRKPPGTVGETPPVRNWINGPLLGLLVLSGLAKVYLVSLPQKVEATNQQVFPAQAAAWIQENLPPGALFNEYNWGGFLAYRLRSHAVFVDGRTDLFDGQLIQEYLQVMAGKDGWEQTLREYGVRVAIIAPGSGLARALQNDSDWDRRYADQMAVIYVSKSD